MYRAAVGFFDFQDNNHFYRAGDEFPRPGVEVSGARIEELATSANRMGFPLIEAEAEEAGEKDSQRPAAKAQRPAAKKQQAKAKKKG